MLQNVFAKMNGGKVAAGVKKPEVIFTRNGDCFIILPERRS